MIKMINNYLNITFITQLPLLKQAITIKETFTTKSQHYINIQKRKEKKNIINSSSDSSNINSNIFSIQINQKNLILIVLTLVRERILLFFF